MKEFSRDELQKLADEFEKRLSERVDPDDTAFMKSVSAVVGDGAALNAFGRLVGFFMGRSVSLEHVIELVRVCDRVRPIAEAVLQDMGLDPEIFS